jgi:hypothetical protein
MASSLKIGLWQENLSYISIGMEAKEILCPVCGEWHEWPRCKPKLRDIHVWVKPEHYDQISRAAEARGLSVTAYVRSAAVLAANAKP